LLFLSSNVFGRDPGWIGALQQELDELPPLSTVSPTLLFEDFSVKFAGIQGVSTLNGTPYVAPTIRYAGFPAARLEHEPRESQPVLAGTLECCLTTREAYALVGGFSAGYALGTLRDLDFFLRFGEAGGRAFWTPAITAYALDDGSTSTPEYWVQTGQMVDGWTFRQSWARHLGVAPRSAAQ